MIELRQVASPGQAEPKPRRHNPPSPKATARHRWGPKVVVSPYKSERQCENGCLIVKVTRHEHHSHWVEYWRGLEKIDVIRTPACELVDQGADA
jgi:hypothetical protein